MQGIDENIEKDAAPGSQEFLENDRPASLQKEGVNGAPREILTLGGKFGTTAVDDDSAKLVCVHFRSMLGKVAHGNVRLGKPTRSLQALVSCQFPRLYALPASDV